MSTTNNSGNVAVLEQIAEPLTARLLHPREKHLNHRAPRSEYVHQVRRDVKCGKKTPIKMLLAVLLSDGEDGVPLPILLGFVDELRDVIVQHVTPAARPCGKTLRTLLLNEARAEGERNLIEIELHADPENVALQRRFLEASRRYEIANDALCGEVSRRAAAGAVQYPTVRPRAMVLT